MSWGHRPQEREWLVNSRILDESANAVMKSVRVIRDYDVPYVGSCSKDGKRVYIDQQLPKHLTYRGKRSTATSRWNEVTIPVTGTS